MYRQKLESGILPASLHSEHMTIYDAMASVMVISWVQILQQNSHDAAANIDEILPRTRNFQYLK